MRNLRAVAFALEVSAGAPYAGFSVWGLCDRLPDSAALALFSNPVPRVPHPRLRATRRVGNWTRVGGNTVKTPVRILFAFAFASAVPRNSTHQSPQLPIVSFRTDSAVCAEREESIARLPKPIKKSTVSFRAATALYAGGEESAFVFEVSAGGPFTRLINRGRVERSPTIRGRCST